MKIVSLSQYFRTQLYDLERQIIQLFVFFQIIQITYKRHQKEKAKHKRQLKQNLKDNTPLHHCIVCDHNSCDEFQHILNVPGP